jgi:GNAT superfamily N-acetyltransferase
MRANAPPQVEVRDLLDAPECVRDVVGWIDAQWSALSGRTREQTVSRFTEGVVRGALPITMVAIADAGTCVGVASLRIRDSVEWLADVTPWICNVYVPAPARGQGVAGRLCLALEERARLLGYGAVYLATGRADSLYHRIGYRELCEVEHGGEISFVLRKVLP